MKLPHHYFLAALAAFLLSTTHSVQAGAAVASDGHGGYGFSYGDRSERRLREEAYSNCASVSHFRRDVRVLTSTSAIGAGVVVRYWLPDGREQIAAYIGSPSGRYARDKAIEYALRHGAVKYRVVREWRE